MKQFSTAVLLGSTLTPAQGANWQISQSLKQVDKTNQHSIWSEMGYEPVKKISNRLNLEKPVSQSLFTMKPALPWVSKKLESQFRNKMDKGGSWIEILLANLNYRPGFGSDPSTWQSLEEADTGSKTHTCQSRYMSGGSSTAPGQFFPVNAGTLTDPAVSVPYQGRCFRELTFELVNRSDKDFSIHVTASGRIHHHQKCSEWLLLANNTQWKQISIHEPGTVQYDFRLMSPEAEVDMSFNGISVFGFCVSKSSAFISLIETGIAFLDWKERPQPHLPIIGHFSPVSWLSERATKRALRQLMGIELEERKEFRVKIDKDLVQSGDMLAIMRVWGGAELIMYGTGSPVGHVAQAIRFDDGELYVVEADRVAGVTKTKWDDWFDWSASIGNNVVWMPLKPELREKFDVEAAIDFFHSIEGLPYGFASLLFSWVDTNEENLPPLLAQSFTPYAFSYAERFMPETVDLLYTQAMNLRLGTQGLKLPQVAKEAAEKGMTMDELMAVPERISWEYNGMRDGPSQSFVCSSFIASMFEVAGLFDHLEEGIEPAEFNPKDIIDIGFYDTDFDFPAQCRHADPDSDFCQLVGNYRLDLRKGNQVEPYDKMDERCPSVWPFYERRPGC